LQAIPSPFKSIKSRENIQPTAVGTCDHIALSIFDTEKISGTHKKDYSLIGDEDLFSIKKIIKSTSIAALTIEIGMIVFGRITPSYSATSISVQY
jgi:hypothetical protein